MTLRKARQRPGSLSRRRFVQVCAVVSSGLALSAACAPAAPAAKPAESKPAETKPAAPAAAGATTAPAKPAADAKPAAAPAQAVSAKPFIIVDGGEPNSLDPPVGTSSYIGHSQRATMEGLVTFNTKMEPVPQLALSWQNTPDLKTWTFKLRKDVKFHDGTPFNSEAVKFSIMRILDPEVASTRRSSYDMIAEIKTPDAETAIFELKSPQPDMPALLGDRSALILSPTAVQKAGNKEFGRAPVGTGQFMFKEWAPKTKIEVVANPNYWGPKAKVSGMIYRPIPEGAARVASLRTGEADIVMKLPPEDLAMLQSDQNLSVVIQPSLTQMIGQWFTGNPPFGDVRVRKAANMAIDRNAIVKNVLTGVAEVPRGPASPRLAGAIELPPIPYDPEASKKLLAEAGYPDGFSGECIYISGRLIKDDQITEAVVSYLGKVGIKLTIKKVEAAEQNAALAWDPKTHNNDLVLPTRTSQFLDYHLYRLYQSDATWADAAQRSGYKNAEVDRLLAEGRKSADPAVRYPAYQQASKIIWEEHALAWIADLSSAMGSRKTATGWEYLPMEEIVITNAEKA